jgi:hypothetical protein
VLVVAIENFAWTCPKCERVFDYDTKQKLAVSRYKHENRVGGCGPPSKLPDGSPNPTYFKAWYKRKGEVWRAHVLESYHKNPEPKKKYQREYYHANTRKVLNSQVEYLKQPEARRRHNQSAIKTQARRRNIEIQFTLNQPLPGEPLHHAEAHIGVYTTKAVHNSPRHNLRMGKNMIAINEAVAKWMIEQDPDQKIFQEEVDLVKRLREMQHLDE